MNENYFDFSNIQSWCRHGNCNTYIERKTYQLPYIVQNYLGTLDSQIRNLTFFMFILFYQPEFLKGDWRDLITN